MNIEKCRILIKEFVDGKLSADDFERSYLDMFKSETEHLDHDLYLALNKLFIDVDAYCPNQSLRGPDDLDAEQLLQSAKLCLSKIQII